MNCVGVFVVVGFFLSEVLYVRCLSWSCVVTASAILDWSIFLSVVVFGLRVVLVVVLFMLMVMFKCVLLKLKCVLFKVLVMFRMRLMICVSTFVKVSFGRTFTFKCVGVENFMDDLSCVCECIYGVFLFGVFFVFIVLLIVFVVIFLMFVRVLFI